MGAAERTPSDDAAAVAEDAIRELVRRGGDELTVGAALRAALEVRDAADHRIFELVGFARTQGASWSEIGTALGVTTQAAHQRYGRGRPGVSPTRPQP